MSSMRQILAITRDYLILTMDKAGVAEPEKAVEKYTVQPAAADSKSAFFKKLVDHAYNKQMGQNVIGEPIKEHQSDFDELLFNYIPEKVLSTYGKPGADGLLSALRRARIARPPRKGALRAGYWPQFCQSILASAHFVESIDFEKFLREINENDLAKVGAIRLISSSIFWYGDTMAADVLKEAGLLNTVKPDTHIDKLKELLGWQVRSQTELMVRMNQECEAEGVVPYAFDKLVWLAFAKKYKNFYNQPEHVAKAIVRHANRDHWEEQIRAHVAGH